jgi:hypothetical protein
MAMMTVVQRVINFTEGRMLIGAYDANTSRKKFFLQGVELF